MIEALTIIGHRGAAGLEPENTIPSFRRALELGCRALELDVHRLPRDGDALAVVHDQKLDRTTNLKGDVAQFTRQQLQQAVPPVPTLEEVIESILRWCNDNQTDPKGITLNIELKGKNTAPASVRTMQRFPDLGYLASSFDHAELKLFRELDQATMVAPLFHRWQPDCTKIAYALSASHINLSKRIVTEKRIRSIRQKGYKVWVYTVNTKRSARRLARLGVDGIFTDRPDRML